MAKIGLPENKALFKEVADQAITLVKDKQDIWPVTPEKYKRVLLVDVKGVQGGFGALLGGKEKAVDIMKDLLEATRIRSDHLGINRRENYETSRRRKSGSHCECLCTKETDLLS